MMRIIRLNRIRILAVMIFMGILLLKNDLIRTVTTWLKSESKWKEANPSTTIASETIARDTMTHNNITSDTITSSTMANNTITNGTIASKIIANSDPHSYRVLGVNCAKVIQGNQLEMIYAMRRYMYHKLKSTRELTDYPKLTSNCSQYIKDRNYILNFQTEDEENFPIGFCILMYKEVDQFEMLLRAIYRPQNSYCIHVDGKSSDEIYNEVRAIASCFENVFLTPDRITVIWGSMSVLDANLHCMKTLFDSNKRWKYFINLTGQEYPLKTNYELVKIFKAYNGSNDMYGAREQFLVRWSKHPPPPHDIIPTKGPLIIAACRGFVEFALYDQRAHDLLEWVKPTFIPDETFFASLNYNPHLKVPGSSRVFVETTPPTDQFMAHFINWGDYPCHGEKVRDVCVLGIRDLPFLSNRYELFANKFDWEHQGMAYECMDELLYNRSRDEYVGNVQFNTSWYSSRSFVLNKLI